ncbi:hypothetical protein E2C01_004131 [Portunus trituberculatus]|uniref:Uncharacterized protein n=1 Tax=Portunus trituberculatus TaxID=210409 RepID=A0A5B7CS24_PORTR|nr:hypothetical protein [Portunus trituberculatus]
MRNGHSFHCSERDKENTSTKENVLKKRDALKLYTNKKQQMWLDTILEEEVQAGHLCKHSGVVGLQATLAPGGDAVQVPHAEERPSLVTIASINLF